jgi:hypothetical protein
VLRRIFEPKREEAARCHRVPIRGLHNLYFSPNVIKIFESKRMLWSYCVYVRNNGCIQKFSYGYLRENLEMEA